MKPKLYEGCNHNDERFERIEQALRELSGMINAMRGDIQKLKYRDEE